MDRGKFGSHWILVTGIIITLIGIVHTSSAPMMYQQMMKDEAIKDKVPGLVYFFAFDGVAVIFAGLLTVFSCFGLKKTEKWAWTIAISSGLFVALGSLGAVAFAEFTNPMIYAMGISAVSNVFLLLIFYRNFNK